MKKNKNNVYAAIITSELSRPMKVYGVICAAVGAAVIGNTFEKAITGIINAGGIKPYIKKIKKIKK